MAPALDDMAEYRRRWPGLSAAADTVARLMRSLLDDEGVNHLSVEGRAKDPDSFAQKAAKMTDTGDRKYADPLTQITDLVAVRIITYLQADVDRVLDIVKSHFKVVEQSDKGALTAARGEYGYSSHHLLATLSGARAGQAEYASLRNLVLEVQVRTTLQHAWAEFEHDVRYKAEITGAPQAEINRRFTLAAGLLELADNEFTRIDALTRTASESLTLSDRRAAEDPASEDVVPVQGQSLANYLSARYPGAPRSKQDHYDWIANLLAHVPLRTIADLDEALGPEPRWDTATGRSAVRALDDELLTRLGGRWIEANRVGGDGRVLALQRRLEDLG